MFTDIGGPEWGGDGRLFQLLEGVADVVIEHNTAFQTGPIIVAEGAPSTGFVYRHNITLHSEYGVKGSGSGVGIPTLVRYFPGAGFERNVLVGQPTFSSLYPPRNYFPATLGVVGFSDLAAGDYRLAPSSPYKRRASSGDDIGVDLAALDLALGGLVPTHEKSSPPERKTPVRGRER